MTGVKALVVGTTQWWDLNSNLSLLVHQLVHFLTTHDISTSLLYPGRERDLTVADRADMTACRLDGVLCADVRPGLAASYTPADCLNSAYSTYYSYLLQDADTFADITHVLAFAPDSASTAIRLKKDFLDHYRKVVKVILINHRCTNTKDNDGKFVEWFSKSNSDQVWSIGQTVFEDYQKMYTEGTDLAPHRLLLFRPSVGDVQLDLANLQETQVLTALSSDAASCRQQLKQVGEAVAHVKQQVVNLGSHRFRWKVATNNTDVVKALPKDCAGHPTAEQLNPQYIPSLDALSRLLHQSKLYVSAVTDDSSFNILDWLMLYSGMPALLSSFSCVARTLEALGRQHTSIHTKHAVVPAPPYGSQTDAWRLRVGEVLLHPQTAVTNSNNLRSLLQNSDFIQNIETAFINGLRSHSEGEPEANEQTTEMKSSPGEYLLEVYPKTEDGIDGVPSFFLNVELSGTHLQVVAAHIAADWFRLGLQLGLPHNTLDTLSAPVTGGPERFAARMLHGWRQQHSNSNYEDVKHLIAAALENQGRQDLGKTVLEAKTASENDLQQLFEKISPKLTQDWRTVGAYLGLGGDDLDRVSAQAPLVEDPRYRMLELWGQRATPQQAVPELVRALREIGRNDIIKRLCSE